MSTFKCGTITVKTCSTCKKDLPAFEFHARKERRDGLQPSCKSCQAEQSQKWREANRQKHRAFSRASHAKAQGYSLPEWDQLQYLKQQRAVITNRILTITNNRTTNLSAR